MAETSMISSISDRVILHCDCNSYYASVESVDHPEYARVPMAVCGDPEGRRGIILAKNEHAKKFGVVTAETIWQAKKKCPNLLLVPPRHHLYGKYCEMVNEIYGQFTDQVEPFSIDESWLDVTGSVHLFGDGKAIADELRRRVREELKITISAGVSFNKIFAKIGSDYKKPDATTVIPRENYKEILYPLPVKEMMFVGHAAAETLKKVGITTIGQLAESHKESIVAVLGKVGETVWSYANGLDESVVRRREDCDPAKSVGSSLTFHRDLIGPDDQRAGLIMLCDTVGMRLRAMDMKCATVQVHIRNPAFKLTSRQRTLKNPTSITRDIYQTAFSILSDSWNPKAPIRMMMVTATGLGPKGSFREQMSFFERDELESARQTQLEAAVDTIRNRFGRDSIALGRIVRHDLNDDHWYKDGQEKSELFPRRGG